MHIVNVFQNEDLMTRDNKKTTTKEDMAVAIQVLHFFTEYLSMNIVEIKG